MKKPVFLTIMCVSVLGLSGCVTTVKDGSTSVTVKDGSGGSFCPPGHAKKGEC
ncbi:MAG: hypothetical protein KDI13_01230 [Alphaproteobacteria bacterium]|nr:hypothetical protein [Alphaproteobacteria bacterium]